MDTQRIIGEFERDEFLYNEGGAFPIIWQTVEGGMLVILRDTKGTVNAIL